ncbi:hypothetical protein [Flavobacterium tructae]|uniref:hypothetical protein n=1 Tax=Flavobacterium tructae TaxID=1114873 RepID=UPI0035A8BBE5
MKKIIALVFIVVFISCKKEHSLEHYFNTNQNEYWAWYQSSDHYFEGFYVTFNNHKYKNYFMSPSEGYNVIKEYNKGSVGIPWSVTKDSFLIIYNDKKKIIFINDKVMVLSSEDVQTGKYKHSFLIKEKIDKDHKSSYYYEQKNRRNFGPLLPGAESLK